FVPNSKMTMNADADQIVKVDDNDWSRDLYFPGLNEPVGFTEQPSPFSVQMDVACYRDLPPVGNYSNQNRKQFLAAFAASLKKHQMSAFSKVNGLRRQAWLLKADGTSIPQSHKPQIFGSGNAGWENDWQVFVFSRKPTDEIAGIVLSVSGKLYCRAPPNDWSKP
ncbi:MAG: hypothetical protein ACREDS_13190, partial [Limisphaerales bacterium]